MRYQACVAIFCGVITGASAHGFGGRARPATATAGYAYPYAYSYYVPVVAPSCYGMPAPVRVLPPCPPGFQAAPRVVPLTASPAIPFAPPRPAPPSPEPPTGKTSEPPLGKSMSLRSADDSKRAPQIVETRGPAVAPPLGKERCKVGFWNVSGRDIDLVVAGKTHTLQKDRALTLEVDRQFSWQVAGRAAAQERVPEEKAFHEIVLRE